MKEYEVVWEIFNLCSNNQMRDVFIEEAEIADTEQYAVSYTHLTLPTILRV